MVKKGQFQSKTAENLFSPETSKKQAFRMPVSKNLETIFDVQQWNVCNEHFKASVCQNEENIEELKHREDKSSKYPPGLRKHYAGKCSKFSIAV